MRIERASQITPGDVITWRKRSSDIYLGAKQEGEVLERSGRNILVDVYGSTDWLWFSDLVNVHTKEP